MHVLVLAPELFGYGGIQVASRMVLRAVAETQPGCRITVLSSLDSPKTMTDHYGPRSWGAAGNRKKMAIRSVWELNRRRWDAVLVLHVNLAPLLVPTIRRHPTLVAVYGIDVWRPLGPLTGRGMRIANSIWSISEHTARKAVEFNPWLAGQPTTVCLLGTESVSDSTDSPSPHSRSYVLSIGRMHSQERYKGFDELIGVWPKMSEKRPDLDLLLMGDGPDRARLEGLAKGNPNIRFLGRVSDGERDLYLRHCRAFALPSSGEGFGLVYLEAMRVGKPALAGTTDAGCEVVLDGVTGRAVDPRRSDELLAGLLDIAGPNGEQYGPAGRTRYETIFTYSQFRDRFADLVNRLTARSG